jgi:serine/threonine protein kinase
MFYKKNKKLESQLYTKMHATLLAIIDTLKSLFDGLLAWLLSIFSSDSGLTLRFRSRTVLYRKADVLGEGAYGTVVKGQDRLSSKKYAIKIMNCPNYEVESVINNEIESLNKFKHKNIIELIDSHSAVDNGGQKVVFLLFPLCSGGSLRSYLNGIVDDGYSKQPLKTILKDFNKICSAVGSLHDYSPSHIHQDIKPDNILIQDGIPILTDFGSVRLAHREVSTRQQVRCV